MSLNGATGFKVVKPRVKNLNTGKASAFKAVESSSFKAAKKIAAAFSANR